MILRNVTSVVTACLSFLSAALASLTPAGLAQDMSRTVLPITQLKWVGLGAAAKFGTGFCLDPECRLIGTNYHVAVMARPRKIKREKVIHRYLATGPEDDGATMNQAISGSPMRYTLGRDLAIFELRHPLPHYHGIAFSLNELQIGQQVDIYTYPAESINPLRNLARFHGAFRGETIDGLLAFNYSFSNGKGIRPGASGGIVVDSKTQQIVGVLSGIARDDEAVAMAVPIQSLADFVSKAQPWLAQSIFPPAAMGNISPASADLYPKFVPPPANDSLQHRPDEPSEVKLLRQKAQVLADGMRNLVAVQTFAWGSGVNNAPAAMAEYEVKVLDGFQRFRDYPDGKKELENVPFPPVNTVVVPGGEWSELPQMVGTALHLKIHQAADSVVNGRRIKVFQYRAESEDAVPCNFFKSVLDLVFFPRSRIFTVPCYGEVWTDEDFNILRISEHLELPGNWKDYESVVTYGWLQRTDEAPQLVPLTISTQAVFKKKVYWCRGLFTNYRIFTSRAKLLAHEYVQDPPP
jgi:hypothetical protein